jgi:hypothetical protein
MSHLQHHHHQQQHPQYVHYTGPVVAPQDTAHQQQQQQQALIPSNPTPLVATGDWTKDLIHLAKTAELKYVFFFTDVDLAESLFYPSGFPLF